jgi:hypothetical protein
VFKAGGFDSLGFLRASPYGVWGPGPDSVWLLELLVELRSKDMDAVD